MERIYMRFGLIMIHDTLCLRLCYMLCHHPLPFLQPVGLPDSLPHIDTWHRFINVSSRAPSTWIFFKSIKPNFWLKSEKPLLMNNCECSVNEWSPSQLSLICAICRYRYTGLYFPDIQLSGQQVFSSLHYIDDRRSLQSFFIAQSGMEWILGHIYILQWWYAVLRATSARWKLPLSKLKGRAP